MSGERQNLALSQPETAPVPSVAVAHRLLAPLSQGFFCEEERRWRGDKEVPSMLAAHQPNSVVVSVMTVPARVRTNGRVDGTAIFHSLSFVSSVNVSFRVMSTQYLEIEWTIRAKRFVARRATFLDGAYPLSTTYGGDPADGTRLWGILLENPSQKGGVKRGSPCPGILPPQFLHSCHAFWLVLFVDGWVPRLVHGTILGSTLLPPFHCFLSFP